MDSCDDIEALCGQLAIKLASCSESVRWLKDRQQKPFSANKESKDEYNKIAELMFRRATQTGSLSQVISATKSIRTFQKRVAAIRSFVYAQIINGKSVLINRQDLNFPRLYAMGEAADWLCKFLPEFCRIVDAGFTGERVRRASKRRAISGLPEDWREQLCQRAAQGKYAIPLAIEALTGCRPSELGKGITLWVAFHPLLEADCLMLRVQSSKVRDGHCLPHRYVAFRVDRAEEIIQLLIQQVSLCPEQQLTVSVANPGNLSKEMARLARTLWPNHKHSVTSTCFRHQSAASTKRFKGGDAASTQLGHLSSRTRKYYGTAAQGRSSLVPDWIGAELPVEMALANDSNLTPRDDAAEIAIDSI